MEEEVLSITLDQLESQIRELSKDGNPHSFVVYIEGEEVELREEEVGD